MGVGRGHGSRGGVGWGSGASGSGGDTSWGGDKLEWGRSLAARINKSSLQLGSTERDVYIYIYIYI